MDPPESSLIRCDDGATRPRRWPNLTLTYQETPPLSPQPGPSSPVVCIAAHTLSAAEFASWSSIRPVEEYPGSLMLRWWTSADMMEAARRLPHISVGGEKYAKELLSFCKVWRPTSGEVHRLLKRTLDSDAWMKLEPKLRGDEQPAQAEWDESKPWEKWVLAVAQAIKEAFPLKIDLNKVWECCQEHDEKVITYYYRLMDVFEKYGGFSKPDSFDGPETAFETYMKTHFMKGLRSSVSTAAKKTIVGPWEDERLTQLLRHAKHAEMKEREERENERKRHENIMLQVYLSMTKGDRFQPTGRDHWRGRNGGKGSWKSNGKN